TAKKLEELVQQAAEIKKEADYNQFLFDELEKADLRGGEQEELEEEQKILEHAEEIKRKLLENTELMTGQEFAILSSLQTVSKNLSSIKELSEVYRHLSDRIESSLIELKDIAHEIESEEQRIEFDQTKQDAVGERLSLIYHLQQKHNVTTIAELLQIKDSVEEKLQVISGIDDELDRVRR